VISVAVNVALKGGKVADARIALCGAGPHAQRCAAAEEIILGAKLNEAAIARAAEAAEAASAPATDAVASEWYRRRMVGVYLRRALAQLA
jgi:CO/xanthine dehydrogenase FAD-binding subunit